MWLEILSTSNNKDQIREPTYDSNWRIPNLHKFYVSKEDPLINCFYNQELEEKLRVESKQNLRELEAS